MASPDSQTPAADTPVRAFHWTLKTQGVIAPDERLPWPQMVAMGLQHVVAMFGATVLAPLLMGFDPNIAILMSGVGTLLFFLVVRGRVPSYLGSSFAFISVVIAATGYAGVGPNGNLPVALVLVAENLGHIKAVSAMTGRNLDTSIGRAFIGDGVATIVSGTAGGTGVTTYAENIGVMAVTRVYSTLIFVIAALAAILLGFSPKFGAAISTIPPAVLGGVSIVVFGLITVAGARFWVDHQVDFSQNGNLIVAAVTLILGAGDFSLHFGNFQLGGIGTATFGAIILNALLNRSREQ